VSVATDIIEHMNEARDVSSVAPEARRLATVIGELAMLPAAVDDDAARIDVIAELERMRSAVAAAQLQVIEAFTASQEAANRELGFEARAARRGVPEQVGLARRVSPASASRQVTQAKTLVRELPGTLALLQAGEISEFAATVVINELAVLSADDRRVADERITPQLPGLGPKRAQGLTRRIVIELDQQAVVDKAAKAREDRRVGCRPAPDTMAVLSALLPCEDGVRAYASLRTHAGALNASGDERSRDQIMADTLVERLTGQSPAIGGPVEIGLIMNGDTLLGGNPARASVGEPTGDQADGHAGDRAHDGPNQANATPDSPPAPRQTTGSAAELTGYGPIPAPIARDIIARAAGADAQPQAAAEVFIRRLFTDPVTGTVARIDARRRRFTGPLAAYLRYRDQLCRTPYCEAPIRQLDHIQPHSTGGPTTEHNGRGLCERCNYINQMPGWTATLIDSDRHIVETTTPTGHTYRSHPPPAPGHRRPAHPGDQPSGQDKRSHPPPRAA
jgi:hypothetical protein